MIFSVLIPTLKERRHIFAPLKNKIDRLIAPYKNQVELITLEDNREKTTGAKRNELINQAKGKFSAFIDDDDDIPDHYFHSIITTINNKPDIDCIGLKGFIIWNGKREIFKHSTGLPYSSGKVNGMYLRPPNHLNPMLTKYFKEIKFPDLTFAEDFDFCQRLAEKKLIKNEHFIDLILYYYKFNPNKKTA